MDCPNCGTTMRERDRAGVKIDFCPNCKGVWLDRGELDKIIAIELSDAEDDRGDYERAGERRRDRDDDDDREYRPARDREYYDERRKKSKKSSFFGSLTEMLGGEGADD